MNDFKGTPGPWCFDKRDGEVYSPKAYTSVAVVLGSSEGDANGRLIEAAPDLLDALVPTTKLGMWTESADDDELVIMSVGTIRKMRSAVAKALGEA